MAGNQIATAIFRRLYPVPPLAENEAPLTPEERRLYAGWTAAFTGLLFLIIPAMSLGWYLSLSNAADYCYPDPPGTVRLIKGSRLVWAIPSLPLGIVTSAWPLEWFVRLFLGDRARRLKRLGDETCGYDGNRVLRRLIVVFLVGSALYFAFAIRMFVRFDAGGMELGRPFRLATHYYPDASIRGVEHRATVRNLFGEVVPRAHYSVIFDDGSDWEVDAIYDFGAGREEGMAAYIAARAGRSIVPRP